MVPSPQQISRIYCVSLYIIIIIITIIIIIKVKYKENTRMIVIVFPYCCSSRLKIYPAPIMHKCGKENKTYK